MIIRKKFIETVDISGWADEVKACANLLNPYQRFEHFTDLAEECLQRVNTYKYPELINFRKGRNTNGVLLIKGALLDENLPPTIDNIDELIDRKNTYYSEFYLMMLSRFLGEPFSYRQERNGTIIHNMRPKRGNEREISSDSSEILLDLHNENIYHPVYPDYLLFCGLRKDPAGKAKTIVVSVDDFYNNISPYDIPILRSKRFRTSIDFNFGNTLAERGSGVLIQVLFGPADSPFIAYDDEYIAGIDAESQATLNRLRTLLHNTLYGFELEQGEILLLDNLRTLHGRTAFKARYDGTDRWMQRVLVTRDIRKAAIQLGNSSRVTDWVYSPSQVLDFVDRKA